MYAPIHVSAPGKLFLIGEYAVLDGAPAILTAVDRRVHVHLAPSPNARWHVSAPNLGLHNLALKHDGRLPADIEQTTADRLKVFDAVRATVAEWIDTTTAVPMEPVTVTIDSSEFARDGGKLGLGSSAAVAAALTQALALGAGLEPSRSQLAERAIAAHRRAQNGACSGGDVAAAVYGGVIRYIHASEPVALSWPASLAGMAVVTGDGAATTDLVARVKAYSDRDRQGYAADIARLSRLADTAPAALAHTSRFLPAAREYFEALIALDRHAHAGIVTRRHHELNALAARHYGVFKTSGAGGGDVGLVFVRAGDDAQAMQHALETAGAHVLPLAFTAPGVRIESAPRAL